MSKNEKASNTARECQRSTKKPREPSSPKTKNPSNKLQKPSTPIKDETVELSIKLPNDVNCKKINQFNLYFDGVLTQEKLKSFLSLSDEEKEMIFCSPQMLTYALENHGQLICIKKDLIDIVFKNMNLIGLEVFCNLSKISSVFSPSFSHIRDVFHNVNAEQASRILFWVANGLESKKVFRYAQTFHEFIEFFLTAHQNKVFLASSTLICNIALLSNVHFLRSDSFASLLRIIYTIIHSFDITHDVLIRIIAALLHLSLALFLHYDNYLVQNILLLVHSNRIRQLLQEKEKKIANHFFRHMKAFGNFFFFDGKLEPKHFRLLKLIENMDDMKSYAVAKCFYLSNNIRSQVPFKLDTYLCPYKLNQSKKLTFVVPTFSRNLLSVMKQFESNIQMSERLVNELAIALKTLHEMGLSCWQLEPRFIKIDPFGHARLTAFQRKIENDVLLGFYKENINESNKNYYDVATIFSGENIVSYGNMLDIYGMGAIIAALKLKKFEIVQKLAVAPIADRVSFELFLSYFGIEIMRNTVSSNEHGC